MARHFAVSIASIATAAVLTTTSGQAQDSYCQNLRARILPNHLYAASCPSARCLVDLTGSRATLRKGGNYRLLLGLGGDLPPQSVVLIKAKYMNKAAQPAAKPPSVGVRREQIEFGCNPVTGSKRPEAAYPKQGEASVSFEGYDNYHRLGFASVDDRRKLNRFHFSYRGERGCRSTYRNSNEFLLHMPNYQPGFLARSGIRLGASTSYAFAAEASEYRSVLSYNEIAVRLTGYERSTRVTACVSVDIKSRYDMLDIDFVDLQRVLPMGTPQSWQVRFGGS